MSVLMINFSDLDDIDFDGPMTVMSDEEPEMAEYVGCLDRLYEDDDDDDDHYEDDYSYED